MTTEQKIQHVLDMAKMEFGSERLQIIRKLRNIAETAERAAKQFEEGRQTFESVSSIQCDIDRIYECKAAQERSQKLTDAMSFIARVDSE